MHVKPSSPRLSFFFFYYQFLSGTWVAQKAGPANVLPRVQKHIHIQVAITMYTQWTEYRITGQIKGLQSKTYNYTKYHL